MVFYLQRYSRPFLEKYYLPCIGLVLLTSVSFFVPPKMVPGRGGMLVTLFLVLNNIFSASKVKINLYVLFLTSFFTILLFRVLGRNTHIQKCNCFNNVHLRMPSFCFFGYDVLWNYPFCNQEAKEDH